MKTIWTPQRIRALRTALGENTATFGEAVGRSGRSVEDWEQGRFAPAQRVQALLTNRARAYLRSRAKASIPDI